MDRVLQVVLGSFIRHGTLRLTTARGTVLAFGDGTGSPVAVRFTTRTAEWAVLLDPDHDLLREVRTPAWSTEGLIAVLTCAPNAVDREMALGDHRDPRDTVGREPVHEDVDERDLARQRRGAQRVLGALDRVEV